MATVIALAGCGGEPPAAAAWQEPAAYTYTLDSRCGERALIGRYRIAVEHGRVIRAEGLDESGTRTPATVRSDFVPTLGQLVEELNTARRQGAHVAEITTDPADGHPTTITIDPQANAVDEESCYAITDFKVGAA